MPEAPELHIETLRSEPEDAAMAIVDYLTRHGLLSTVKPD